MREELFHIIFGILIPFLGTTIGAGSVFFVKNEIKPVIQKLLLGFASGIMVAASVWSLLIPAMEMCEPAGKLAFVPAAAGVMELWAEMGNMLLPILIAIIPVTVLVMVSAGRTTQAMTGRKKKEADHAE